ncbi:MAG: outer membrane lipoprotein-sorting protein [Gammaproteobacteria bacterium]|nr:outer membrane lipoprotein-sorting protein [Gammaproteobacteria bacterium]MYF27815.1 outer membrane lipoprotein-sorting protein [Gammaproteobacteria bacterium]
MAAIALFGVAVWCEHSPAPAWANDTSADAKGLAIAREALDRRSGFGSFAARQTMVLRNKNGRESRRDLRVSVLEVTGEGDRSLFLFDEPRDVRGTAFLVHAHKDRPDDQWLYLPALKRVKRISASNRSASFMGSEFSYEDMTPPVIERFTYRYLREERCGDLTCTVVEFVPVDERSAYSRQLVWHDKDEFRPWKVEYYDRKGALLKTMTVREYEKFEGRYWHAVETAMVNHLTGKSTIAIWTDNRFGVTVDEGSFTQARLRRAH